MPQVPDNTPAWVAAIIAAGGALWAIARRLLVSVTREELQEILQEHQAQRRQMHEENLAKFKELFERLGKMEQGVSRIDGELSGRRPRFDR